MTIVTKYWKNIEGVEERRPKKKRMEKSNSITYLLTAFMFLLVFNPIFAIKVNDTFYYCNAQEDNPILDIDGSCKIVMADGKLLKNRSRYNEVYVISRKMYEVHGKAFQCKKEIIQTITTENFFGAKSREIAKNKVDLSPTECATMVKEKKCGERKMTCDDESCYLDNSPEEEYRWLGSIKKEGLRCSLKYRVITARTKEENLFHKNCKATDLHCRMEDSIIVWNEDIISKCPYAYVTQDSFSHTGDDILYSSVPNHLFKLTNKFTECGMEIYGTTEGLYITWDGKVKQFEKSEVELSTVHELILSEQDGAVFNAHLQREALNRRVCETIRSYLKEFRSKDDEFTLVGNSRGFATIIHAQGGILRLPTCIEINQIEVFDIQVVKSDICTPDLLVKFEVQNKTNVGFLTDKNIIRAVPTVSKKCINPLFRYFHMNNILIKRENNKVMKMNNVKTMEIRDIEKRDGSISFLHYKRILEQIDVLSEIKNSHYEDIQDLKEKLLFKDKSEEKNLVIDELTKIKDSTFTIIGEYRSKIMIYLVSIILIIIITFIFIVFCSQRMSIMNWIQKRKIRRELVRLDPLTQEYLRLTKFRNEEL
jgi:hypothetical protein